MKAKTVEDLKRISSQARELALDSYQDKLKRIDEMEALGMQLVEHVEDLECDNWSGSIRVRKYFLGREMEENKDAPMEWLHKVRGQLRTALGKWQDSINHIYCYSDSVQVTFRCPEVKNFGIEVALPREHFPKQWMGKTCRFEKQYEANWSYVCDPQEPK